MSQQPHDNSQNTVILPTAPGANPSSFPDFKVGLELRAHDAPQRGEDSVELPDGSRAAPNGAVIEEPISTEPEILPPHRYTPEKEDLNLLIM